MKSVFTIIIFILLFTNFSHAQTGAGKISGKVLDEKHADLSYASVSLLKAADSILIRGSITENDGGYSFPGLAHGKYLIAIQTVGYGKIVKGPYSIDENHVALTVETVELQPSAKLLNSVEITSKKPLVERQIDKTVLNVENSVLAAGNTALEILQKAPGVSVDKDGNISLRGRKGVMVMLDGKPTYMSSEQLANLLRSTEGNAVQSIELITNPSSKYDAAGNSGIINIKLKKNKNYGTNGSVNAGFGYGRYYKANSGISLNHREKKFNVFGDFNYSRRRQYHELDIVRVNNTAENRTYFDQTSDALGSRRNYNFKVGMDYFLDDKNTLGFVINGYNGGGSNETDVFTRIGSNPLRTDSSVRASTPNEFKYTGITYNLNYKGTIDTLGQEINADVDFSKYTSNGENSYYNNYLDAFGQTYRAPYIFRSMTPSDINVFVGKVDYTYPISKKMKMDLGLKSSIVTTDNNAIFEDFIGNTWQSDLTRSNQFKYDENINAGYINLKRELGKFTIQAGLRAEQTNSKGNSVTEQRIAKRHYLNFFPSVFMNHTLSKNNDIGFSYSRRIDRPDYGDLNPFVYFVDLYTYGKGNPFLNPQYTNSFEITYSYKKTINATLGYSHTNDAITRVLLSDTLRKTLFITRENLAVKKAYNLNINSPLTVIKWWTTNNNVTVFYNKFSTPNLAGAPYSSGKLAFNANTNQTISLDPSTNIEMSGFYQSSMVEGTLSLKPQYGIDLGMSKSFANKRLNIKLAANDVFNLQRWRITSALPGQDYKVNEKDESRVFRITCTYKFGSNDIKGARERRKGSESEQNRVKSGG